MYDDPQFIVVIPLIIIEGLVMIKGLWAEKGTIPNCSLISTLKQC